MEALRFDYVRSHLTDEGVKDWLNAWHRQSNSRKKAWQTAEEHIRDFYRTYLGENAVMDWLQRNYGLKFHFSDNWRDYVGGGIGRHPDLPDIISTNGTGIEVKEVKDANRNENGAYIGYSKYFGNPSWIKNHWYHNANVIIFINQSHSRLAMVYANELKVDGNNVMTVKFAKENIGYICKLTKTSV